MGRRPESISKSRSFFRGKVLNSRAFPREILGELPVSYRIRPLFSRRKPKSQGKSVQNQLFRATYGKKTRAYFKKPVVFSRQGAWKKRKERKKEKRQKEEEANRKEIKSKQVLLRPWGSKNPRMGVSPLKETRGISLSWWQTLNPKFNPKP